MIHNLFKDILMALCQHVAHNSTGAWSGYDRVCTYAVINNVPNDSDCQMPSSERCILISEMSKCEMCTRTLEIMGFNKQVGLLPWCARRPAYRCSESAVAASWRLVLRPRQTTNSPSHTRAFKASAPFRMYCPFSGSPSSFLLFAVSTILTKKKRVHSSLHLRKPGLPPPVAPSLRAPARPVREACTRACSCTHSEDRPLPLLYPMPSEQPGVQFDSLMPCMALICNGH